MPESITTPLTKLFGIKYPILLAGMNVAAGPELAAAVTNAGGLGVIGGYGYTPFMLRKQIQFLKKDLIDKSAPFGVDLLLPQVGGNARKTNYDYTEGKLAELIDIIIEEKTHLFVSAVGVPPDWVIEKLHKAKIPVMNMVGAPKHARKAIAAGVDIICAQGGEGGGHTGDIATSILIPAIVDLCKKHISPLTGQPIAVVAAGGIFDGRGVAMSLCYGADAVWVGTRFICATEAGAPTNHKEAVVQCGYHDTVRTLIYTGRPLRILRTKYVHDWETNRKEEISRLTSQGIIPVQHDYDEAVARNEDFTPETMKQYHALLMGQCAAAVTEIKPAAEIMDEMMNDCISVLRSLTKQISKL